MSHFTEEQERAITSTGKVIVSASAGSGKTTVMIERIVRLIKSGADVNEVLAMTYTKKAAAQMKEKLRKEFIKAINDKAVDVDVKNRLKGQLPKVGGADLSTIHSFCSRLIRSHFFTVGVDSGFSIADEADSGELINRAMDRLFDEQYELANPMFLNLLEVYFRNKKDSALRKIIKSLYMQLRTYADYKEILEKEYKEGATEVKFNKITEQLHNNLKEKCDYYIGLIEEERQYFEDNKLDISVRNADELLSALLEIRSTPDYFTACKIKAPKFSNKQKSTKLTPKDFSEHADNLGSYKDEISKIYKEEFLKVGEHNEELSYYLCAGQTARSLAWLLIKFDEKYKEEKMLRNVLDYNDLEHLALELLLKSEIAEEMQNKYKYVFVDEYQDVNPVQEKILSLLSGENVFLVGDVKQSIYGFRGSKSKYFVEKQKEFEKDKDAKSLFLTKNFRSASEILRAVNTQFSFAMTTSVSEVDYENSSIMQSGGRYNENAGRVEVHILPKGEKEKSDKSIREIYSVEKNYLLGRIETSSYGEEIRKIIEKERTLEWFDADENKFKKTDYSDIAVLVRKKQGDAALVAEALTSAGIPVSSASEINLYDYPEIKTLIDILSLIDNPQQDIPLCSALLSTMGNLTVDDLTDIRLAYPMERFYRDCVKRYDKENQDVISEKLHNFYNYYENIRVYAAILTADELLTKILTETMMEAKLLSLDNGVGCLKRIRYFIAQAATPTAQSVHEFLDRLKTLEYYIPYSESGGENAVRIMTMHASKGLEYPVVILDDLTKEYKGRENYEISYDEEFGIVTRAYDFEKMIYSQTLLRRLYDEKQLFEDVKNELNLFYVAMTRAKYALHMVFSKQPGNANVKYAKCYSDFLNYSTLKEYEKTDTIQINEREESGESVNQIDGEKAKEIAIELNRVYPFTGGENLPAKTSASAILSDKNNSNNEEYYAVSDLFKEEEGNNAQEKEKNRLTGLAYHAFLEHCTFSKCVSEDESVISIFVDEELERMKKEKLLSDNEISLLKKEQLVKILNNHIFKEISGLKLYKERRFLVSLSIKDVYGDKQEYNHCGSDEIILQGVIDLLVEGDNGEYTIVDYKYSDIEEEYLQEKYKEQLYLYKKAVVKIVGTSPENVQCVIVNIKKNYQINL